MYVNPYYGVSSQQVSLLRIGILKTEGFFKGTTADRWLQFFDSCTTPTAGQVPLREDYLPQNAAFYFEFKNGEMRTSEGLFIGVSTTEGTWTASADTMDLFVETDIAPLALTVVGDKTTALNTKQIWSQATGYTNAKFIYEAIVTELLGAARCVCLFADDATVTTPLLVRPLPASSTIKIGFGDAGFRPYAQTLPPLPASNADQVKGCTLVVANVDANGKLLFTAGVGPTVTASSANILAITN